jgi:hypothetical protein
MFFLIVAPPDPREPWFVQSVQSTICTISGSFYVNLCFSGFVILEKKSFGWPYPIFVIISLLKRTWPFISPNFNPFMQRWFVRSLIKIGSLVLEKKIYKRFFSNIDACKNCFPHCGPTRPPGTMICTNLSLHYIRKLLCKSELFWLCGSWEDI